MGKRLGRVPLISTFYSDRVEPGDGTRDTHPRDTFGIVSGGGYSRKEVPVGTCRGYSSRRSPMTTGRTYKLDLRPVPVFFLHRSRNLFSSIFSRNPLRSVCRLICSSVEFLCTAPSPKARRDRRMNCRSSSLKDGKGRSSLGWFWWRGGTVRFVTIERVPFFFCFLCVRNNVWSVSGPVSGRLLFKDPK